jgi:predicted chitinase
MSEIIIGPKTKALIALNTTYNVSNDQLAYILATVKHETANTFEPIEEYGKGAGNVYGELIQGHKYYGRGYVQLTWQWNYKKFGDLLGVDLVENPDLALEPDIAGKILYIGMIKGLFTGKKLDDYINEDGVDYINARRIINGTDKDTLIASYATTYRTLLNG